MPRTRRWIVFELLLAAPVLLAQTAVTPIPPDRPVPDKTAHHKKNAIKPLVLPPLPQGPLNQLPMDQIPSTPAKVSFQGGLLSISAQNSTLGEILRDVRQLTGAAIDIPPGSGANERVVTHLGPGAPRDVLAGLLNGSSFNYVMVGSSADPRAITSVVLTPKTSPAGETQTAASVFQNNNNEAAATPQNRFPQPMPFNQNVMVQPGGPQPAAAAGDDEEASDAKDEEENADENADDQGQGQPGQPPQPDTTGAGLQNQQSDPNQPNAGPKTPEQILEMLRRQQQPGASVMNPDGQPPPQQ